MNRPPCIVKGWTIFAEPLFLAQVEKLQQKVSKLQQKYPDTWTTKDSAKRLATIANLILEEIPEDPSRAIYRQGDTLGSAHKHWFRAKFYQQYRLFFRYHSQRKIIILGWVNDSSTKRVYDGKTDAYKVFRKMLESGHPPTEWDELLTVARGASDRLGDFLDGL